jgi:SAM-dependent methyltransferase
MNGEICHLCRAPAVRGATFQKRKFLHCENCDLVFVPAAEHVSADEAKARYLRHHNTTENAGYVEMLRVVVDLIQQYAPGARRVLDYGCGPAPVLARLWREAGYGATGYDPIFARDAAATGLFDVVTAVETFEHFAEPRRDMERIVGMLRPGGVLVAQTLLHSGLEGFADWWYARDVTHVAFYSAKTMEWIARQWELTRLYTDDKALTAFWAS